MLSFAALILLATAPSPVSGRVAVAVVGGPAEPAEHLQRDLESLLAGQRFTVANTAEWSLKLAAAPAATPAPVANPEFERQIKEVGAAFYDGKVAAASTELEAAMKALRPFSSADRGQLQKAFLWEATLAQSRNDEAEASAAIRHLLLLAPETKVDLDLYPPTVEALRLDLFNKLKPVTVQVAGNPHGVEILAEGVPVGSSFGMPVGGREIEVRVPGLRPVRLSLAEAATSIVVSPAPALQPDPATLSRLTGDRHPAEFLQSIRNAAGAEAVVVALIDPVSRKVRAVVWTAAPLTQISPEFAFGDSALGQWVADQLRPPKTVAAATPLHPPATPSPGPGAAGANWVWGASIGGGVDYLKNSLSGTAAAPATPHPVAINVPLAGPAPEVSAGATHQQLRLTADLSSALFQFNKVSYGGAAPLPPPSGGSFLAARLGGEWAFGDEERGQVSPLLSIFYQQYQVSDPGGALASWKREGLTLGVRGRARLTALAGSPLWGEAGIGLSPSSVAEPGKVSGTSARASLAPQGGVALRWSSGRWDAAAHIDGEQFTAAFSGKANLAYGPLTTISRTWLIGVAGLSFGRRF